jgi:type II secretory pathway component PulK
MVVAMIMVIMLIETFVVVMSRMSNRWKFEIAPKEY